MSNLVKVKDVIERVNTKEDRFNTDRLYYVGGEHFQSRALTVDDRGIIKGSTIGPMFYYGFKSNDFLLVSRNPHLRKAGLVNFDGICSEKTFVLHTKDERILLQKFMPFIFQNERFWKYAIANKHGSTNFFVNWSTLADYSFELPSIEQQKAISKLLWALNDTKKAYEDLIQKTDELVKSQFIEMFGDPVSNSQRRRRVPFAKFIANIRYGTSQPPEFSESGEYKFIRATNIKAGRIVPDDIVRINKSEASKIEKCRLSGGEIIIVRSGVNTGDTCVVTDEYKGQYAGYDIIVTLDLNKSNPVFFNELLNTHYMNDVVKPLTARSAQPHLNSQQVQNLPMIVASIDEQNRFAEIVEQSDKSKFEL